jgi:hypothetical protein
MYGVRLLLVTANARSSLILVTLMMEALRFSETSVLQEPQSVTFLKMAFFIFAVKTSDFAGIYFDYMF